MKIISSAFSHNKFIPIKYTALGDNINPPLIFLDIPKETKSLALIVDDPDAPNGTWIHWIVWNINPTITKIKENSVPEGSIQGKTSQENHYSGPKPPSGTHRYYFKLYALDTMLNLDPQKNINDLQNAIKNHIIDQAELIGLYAAKQIN